MATIAQVLSTTKDNLWIFAVPDGRGLRRADAYLYPYMADKDPWLAAGPTKDVQAWHGWPARQSNLLFAGLAFGNKAYLNLWKSPPADPTNEEVRRNLPITQPIPWVNQST